MIKPVCFIAATITLCCARLVDAAPAGKVVPAKAPGQSALRSKPLTKEQREAVQIALKALRRLQSATQTGLNYPQYSDRLLDIKSDVSEALFGVPAGSLKAHLEDAMQTYVDTRQLWHDTIESPSHFTFECSESFPLIAKYKLDWRIGQDLKEPDFSEISEEERAALISSIWNSASSKIRQIDTELSLQ